MTCVNYSQVVSRSPKHDKIMVTSASSAVCKWPVVSGSLPGNSMSIVARQRNCIEEVTSSLAHWISATGSVERQEDETREGMVRSVGLNLTFDVLKPFLSTSSPLLGHLEKVIYGCQAGFTGVTSMRRISLWLNSPSARGLEGCASQQPLLSHCFWAVGRAGQQKLNHKRGNTEAGGNFMVPLVPT